MFAWMALAACDAIPWPWEPVEEPVAGAFEIGCGPETDAYAVVDEPVIEWPTDLHLRLQYGGGCAEHRFVMCWDGAFDGSADPVQTTATLVHDADGDPCDAILQSEHMFDLSAIREAYGEAFGDEAPIGLVVNGPPEPLVLVLQD
jgi:hypothetical protein